jgi:hypothetical protein
MFFGGMQKQITFVDEKYGRVMEIWIEDEDQATMFSLIWGQLVTCEVW